jgi:hypothetical protein
MMNHGQESASQQILQSECSAPGQEVSSTGKQAANVTYAVDLSALHDSMVFSVHRVSQGMTYPVRKCRVAVKKEYAADPDPRWTGNDAKNEECRSGLKTCEE